MVDLLTSHIIQMPSLGGKNSNSTTTDDDNVEPDCCTNIAPGEQLNEEETTNVSENNEGCEIWTDDHLNTDAINANEHLMARFIPQVPYQYQPTLIQFNEKEECTDYHFGLIRGYHNEMYDGNKQKNPLCLCCSWPEKETSRRIARKNRALMWQIFGVILGMAMSFIGLISLIVSFLVSSDGSRKYIWDSFKISTAQIHILAIVGLSVLTMGSALVSLCLLVPTCSGRRIYMQDTRGTSWCTCQGDLYIKHAEKTYNLSANQFLYFDAAVFRGIFGKSMVKTIQPEIE